MNFLDLYNRLRDDSSVTLAISRDKEHLVVSVRIDDLPTQTVKATPKELNDGFGEFLIEGLSANNEIKDFKKRWDDTKKSELDKLKNKQATPTASGTSRKQTQGEKLMDEANKLFNSNQFSAAYTVFKHVLKTDYPDKAMVESKMRTCEQRMGIGGMFAEHPAPMTPEAQAIVDSTDDCDDDSCQSENPCSECGSFEDVDQETGLCPNCSNELNP